MAKGTEISLNGRLYPSIKAAAHASGVLIGTVRTRRRKGVTGELLFVKPTKGLLSKDHTGQVFQSLKAMADAWGMSPRVVFDRLSRGWSMEETLTKPVRGHR